MERREVLRRLTMSDDEMESIPNLKLCAPSLMDASLLSSPVKSMYGDFSLNSFVVIDSPPETTQEDGGSVYMESVLDLFKSLSSRIDGLSLQRTAERSVLEEAQQQLLLNRPGKALEVISKHTGECVLGMKEAVSEFIERQWPEFLLNIRSSLVGTQEICFNLRNAYKDIESKLFKKLEENERLKNIINQQSVDCRAQVDTLVSESNAMKDGIIKCITDLDPLFNFDSQLEVDLLRGLGSLIAERNGLVEELRSENVKKDGVIREYVRKAKSFEVSHLASQVDELKTTQRKLQEENLNLTNILNKMSEKNTKLKQELVLFNSELKRSLESISKKNEAIARQKTLIEMFQEKLSGSKSFPIEDLRRRKSEIDGRLARETDYFAKQSLKKEKEDCERRLSDFLSLAPRGK